MRRKPPRRAQEAAAHPGPPPTLDVAGTIAQTLIGGLLGVVFAPLVWVFIGRLTDPGPKDALGETLVQLAIAIALCGGAFAIAGARHRVHLDAATRTVTWTRSLFGLPVHRVRWAREEIEVVIVAERQTPRGHPYYEVALVGPRGRRPLKTDSARGEEGRAFAAALGVRCDETDRLEPEASA